MEKIMIVGCGAYIDSGYGCPGAWRCLKAAAMGDGNFESPSQVIAFVECKCPGRTVASNLDMAMKLSDVKPDKIYLSSCLVNPKPVCPYTNPEELAAVIEKKTGVKVYAGTHDYP